MATLREQLMDELMEVGQEDLANAIGSLESDVEAANYIAANKGYFAKKYTTADLQEMPVFRKAMYSDLKTGKVNYDEEFGEGWYKNFNDIPLDQIRFVAEKQGVDWKDLNKNLADEATIRLRRDIAHGEDAGGWFDSPEAFAKNAGGAVLHVFGPRQQEAIERGEEPTIKDISLDAAQSALYAIPYGSTVKAINNPVTRNIIGATLSNAGAPLATEALDYVAYDNDNPRGQFSVGDVATGTGVNLIGGALLRGAGMGIGRVAPKVRTFLGELATGKTTKEAVDEIRQQYKFNVNVANDPSVPQVARQKAQEMVKMMESDPETYAAIASKDPIVFRVAEQEGKTLEDKANKFVASNYPKGKTLVEPTTIIEGKEVKSPVSASLTKAYDKLGLGTATEGLKTSKQLAQEEALKNFITNEFGSIQDEQGKALTRFPLVGPALQKMLEEDAKKKAEHDENMRILDELRAKGLLHSER